MRLRPGVPVLVREPGHAQVGLARPLGLPGLSRQEVAFLASLEGRRIDCSSGEIERFGPILGALDASGLLEDFPAGDVPPTLVRLRGIDPILKTVALGLALGGVSALSVTDGARAFLGPRHHSSGGKPPGSGRGVESLIRSVKDTRPDVRVAGPDERASLEILRAHGALDVLLTRDLVAWDVPHLGIVSDEDGISVGPLIVPGLTPCETCLGISRSEADRWWPRLALQMGDPRRDAGLEVPPEVTLLAGGIALREALGFLRGVAPTSRRWRIPFGGEDIDVETCVARPECGCGAASP